MKPLLCVRHQETAPLGILEGVIKERAIPWRYVDVYDTNHIPDIDEVSGLIVLGGEMGADDIDRYPYLKDLRDLMSKAVEKNVPTLGICLGAQILTRAAGAEVRKAAMKEVGFYPVKATDKGMDDPILEAFTPQSSVFEFHEDECELPAGAELLFEGEEVKVQAYKIGSAYATQFHFEVTPRIISDWCDEVPDLVENWGKSKAQVIVEAERHLETQQEAGREVTAAFLDMLKQESE
jgi:GMP synthase (glutamine-hydrolysing)